MELIKGQLNNAPPGFVRLRRAQVPGPPGWTRLRYLTEDGIYLGEVEFVAINQDAARAIAKDLYQVITGIVVPGL